MDQEVKIEYFADVEQDALERWIFDYVLNSSKVSNGEMDDEFANKVAALKWIRQEGILRLSQSLINVLENDTPVFINRINWLYTKFFTKSAISEEELITKLMQIIDPFVHPQLKVFEEIWAKHRNVCIVLKMIIKKCSSPLKPHISDQLVHYLIHVLDKNTLNSETNLWALMALELLCSTPNRLVESQASAICGKLEQLSANLELLGDRFYKMDFDFSSYQVAFCAQWLADSLQQSGGGDLAIDLRLSPVKLLPGQMTVRTDSRIDPPVKSAYAISQPGVYFYEAVLLTNGPLRIGWATGECDFEFNETERLGDDEFSIAFDGLSQCIWHERKAYPVSCKVNSWAPGDVIGALIDIEGGKAAFYLNGSPVHYKRKLAKKFAKLTEPRICHDEPTATALTFYAAASLAAHDHLYFNFGQQPFAYPPPKDLKWTDFHSAAAFDLRQYQLLQTSLTGGTYWFKRQLINNAVEPLMKDARQKDFNRWIKELESRIFVDDFDYEYFYGDLKWEFEALMKDELAYIRLIQAVIRKLGTLATADQIDVVVGWIIYYLSTLDDTLSNNGREVPEIWFFDRSEVDSSASCPNLPAPAKFLEMIYPYMQLSPQSEADVLKIRNTAIALSILARKYWYLKDFFTQEVVAFVCSILSESQDNCSMLFSLICLDNLVMDRRVKEKVLRQLSTRLPLLAKYLEQLSVGNIFDEQHFDAARYQLAFCARWCLDYVLVDDSIRKPHIDSSADTSSLSHISRSSKRDTLNCESRTEQLKLSPNALSARSDDGWQSVKSTFAVTSGVYFYEVIRLTSGPMRIGWATKETDFYRTNVGDDRHSIGLDRFQRCIWHDADRFKIKSVQPLCAPGDVIGCLIDVPNQKFTFYLNGSVISIKKQFFKRFNFSAEPTYYAAVTLWPFQHVAFNLGQAPFKYPPKGVTFSDFYSASTTSTSPSASTSASTSPSVTAKHSGNLRRRIFDMLPSVAPRVSISAPTIK